MRIERTKNAIRNVTWGLINKFIGLVVPFICRGAIIRIFGINYLGLSSLFTSILSTLSLAELGFGSAVVYFLYQAIADEDENRICALMNFYKKVYRIIGLVIVGAGLALTPFLQVFIKKDLPPDINIYVLYFLSLAGTSITYFLYAYKNSILVALQRNDIVSKISSVVMLTEKLLQLFCIIILKNYYAYLAVTIILNAINNIAISKYVDKNYPSLKARGEMSKSDQHEIFHKIRGLFVGKVGNIVLGSADSIVISAFLGLAVAGIYGNYYYVIYTLGSFLAIYYSSIRAGMGNSIAIETTEKNYQDFKTLQLFQNWLVGWSSICLFCLFQDFIFLYAGRNNLLDNKLILCLAIYFYVWRVQDIVSVYKDAAGLWVKDRYRPLIGAIVNLSLNCLLVQYIGLYGVILSTVFVFVLIDFPWASSVLFKEYFNRSRREYFSSVLLSLLTTIVSAFPTYYLCTLIQFENKLINLITKSFICMILPNIIMLMIYKRSDEFDRLKQKIMNIGRFM